MQLSRRDAATVESGALQFYATTRFECLATTLDTLSLSLFPLAFCLSPVHHPLYSPSSLSLPVARLTPLVPLALVRKNRPRVIDIIVIVIVRTELEAASVPILPIHVTVAANYF